METRLSASNLWRLLKYKTTFDLLRAPLTDAHLLTIAAQSCHPDPQSPLKKRVSRSPLIV